MGLRDYQLDCLTEVRQHYIDGICRQLIVLPTGSGKTVIAAHLPIAMGMRAPDKLLFLVHREELVNQTKRKFEEYNPSLRVEIEKAQHSASVDADVIIASVQSIGKVDSPRLKKFNPELFKIIVVDEAHRAISESYLTVLRHFGVMKGDPDARTDALLVCITATPNRSDNVGLEKIVDQIVFTRDIRSMIKEGWLVDIEAHRIWTETDISHVSTHAGDFAIGELEAAVNTPARNELVVRKYKELGGELPGLAFTVDVKHAHDLAQAFRDAGVSAMALSGKTPLVERQGILDQFSDFSIQVICSCMVLSEGTDLPIATVAMMTRPTKSSLLFTQQIGRVLRPWPAPEATPSEFDYRKGSACVLDFCDLSGRHSLITLSTLFGLRKMDLKGKKVTEALEEIEQLELKYPAIDIRNCETIDEARVTVERVDLFQSVTIPEIVRQHSRFAWLSQGTDAYRLSLPDRTAFIVRENTLGHAEIWKSDGPVRKMLQTCKDLQEAFCVADQMVPATQIGAIMSTARWRKDPPTEAQALALYRWDKGLRGAFGSAKELYKFMSQRYESGDLAYTKGGASTRLSSIMPTRPTYWRKPGT